MKTKIFLALLTLALAAALILRQQRQEAQEFTKWIGANTVSFSIEGFKSNRAIQAKLKEALGNKKVVAIGEATHGTTEFFRIKLDVFQFLVEELGFTIFGLEASYSRCRYINEFIQTGKGDLDTAATIHGFTSWSTEEFRNVIRWMRTYNELHPERKISFIGFDIQLNDIGAQALSDYIGRVDPMIKVQVDTLLKRVLRSEETRGIFSGDTTIRTLIIPMKDLISGIADKKSIYIRSSSHSEFNEVLKLANTLQQYVLAYSYDAWRDGSIVQTRDYFMAENILSCLAASPGNKLFIWAHNGHVANDYVNGISYPSMGSYVKSVLKEEYYAVGFDFYNGNFRADDPDLKNSPGWEKQDIEDAPSGNLANYFVMAGETNGLIDFTQTVKNKIVEKWLHDKYVGMYSIGSQFSKKWSQDRYISHVRLYNSFDAVIFIKESHATTPLPMTIKRRALR